MLSDLLRKAPSDNTEGRERTFRVRASGVPSIGAQPARRPQVVRSLLVSLAHHEAYFSLFNQFMAENLGLLEQDGFSFMAHCMALLSFDNKLAWLRRKLARLM